MIVATLDQLANQAAVPPRLRKALDFLKQTDLLALDTGRVEIEGSEVFALVQSYDSRPIPETPRFEAHRKYLDVQYLASGTEAMGWASLAAWLGSRAPVHPASIAGSFAIAARLAG